MVLFALSWIRHRCVHQESVGPATTKTQGKLIIAARNVNMTCSAFWLIAYVVFFISSVLLSLSFIYRYILRTALPDDSNKWNGWFLSANHRCRRLCSHYSGLGLYMAMQYKSTGWVNLQQDEFVENTKIVHCYSNSNTINIRTIVMKPCQYIIGYAIVKITFCISKQTQLHTLQHVNIQNVAINIRHK